MLFLYNLFTTLYGSAIGIAAHFRPKAALWVAGRKGLLQRMQNELGDNERRIWMHCASLGEFEQGRPVLEALRKEYPNHKIILTFFSPSGYEIRKDYDGANYVYYLPMDSAVNAREFLNIVRPSIALFVKYEFWYHYLSSLKSRNIPTVLFSAVFREKQIFFKPYGGFFRKILHCFSHIQVQDAASENLLKNIGITHNVQIGGDTRYDRVITIAANASPIEIVEDFLGTNKAIVAGSTWPDDELLLQEMLPALPQDWKLIIAPHEIDKAHIDKIMALLGDYCQLYSDALKTKPDASKRILVINNMGMLSRLYRYGEIAYIGGGFNKSGIHNVLEPAVYGLPVIMGPVYKKFIEALTLVSYDWAFPITDAAELKSIFTTLMQDDTKRNTIKTQLASFVTSQKGATEKVIAIVRQLL